MESKKKLPIIIGFVISAIALGYFIQGMKWQQLWIALKDVRLEWIALASLILILEFWLRALRWNILLRPTGIKIPTKTLFSAQVIGVACNTLLPLRAGEIAKPYIASRHTSAPFVKIVATTIMERVFDILGMVFIMLLMLSLATPSSLADSQSELVYNLQVYGGIFGVFAALCMAFFFFLVASKQRSRGVFVRITSIAPTPIAQKLMEFFDVFVDGLKSSTDRTSFWSAGALSLWMWLNGAIAIYCIFLAFGMNLPFGAACFVSVAIALTVALPQAPGFLGVFQVAMEKTMVLWGQPEGPAEGFSIVFWAVSFIPITIIGLLALWKEGLTLKGIQDKGENVRNKEA